MQLLANCIVVQKVSNKGAPTATVLTVITVLELFIITGTLYHFVSFLFIYVFQRNYMLVKSLTQVEQFNKTKTLSNDKYKKPANERHGAKNIL